MRKMVAGNGILLLFLGSVLCFGFIYVSLGNFKIHYTEQPEMGFVGRNGTQFMVDGEAFYVNGWNSYWLMDQAVDEFSRHRVSTMLQAGAKMGLTVCRTWAFNDGAYNALQISPGWFDERVFKATVNRSKGNKTEMSRADLIQKSSYCRVAGREMDLLELSAYGNVRRGQDSGGCRIQ